MPENGVWANARWLQQQSVFFGGETMYIRTTMIHKGKNQGDLSKPALCSSKRVLTAQISGVVVDVVDHETQILKLYVVSSYLSSVDIYL